MPTNSVKPKKAVELDAKIEAMTVAKDEYLANYRKEVGKLTTQREQAIMQAKAKAKAAEMSPTEKEAMASLLEAEKAGK